MAQPIHLGAWSMALMLWLSFELLLPHILYSVSCESCASDLTLEKKSYHIDCVVRLYVACGMHIL